MREVAVELRGAARSYNSVPALHPVNLQIGSGEYIVILGPSGSGKTTMLSLIGGFVRPTEGRILIAGKDVTDVGPEKRNSTTVFQDYALFPHMSVESNVGFGLAMRGIGRLERRARVAEVLATVGLPEFGRRRIHEMSGGQKQRIALARALAPRPSVLLLDEPLGALDMKLRREMQEELKAIQRQTNATFVHVTHDQEEAVALADRIIVMNMGSIADSGQPERIYSRPSNRFVAEFIGEGNLFSVDRAVMVDDSHVVISCALFELSLPNAAGIAPKYICFRPGDIHLSALEGGVRLPPFEVVQTMQMAGRMRITLRGIANPAVTLLANVSLRAHPVAGDRPELWLDTSNVVILEG